MKKFSQFLLLFLVVFIVYSPALSVYFAQDDFTHLSLSEAKNLSELWRFFIPVKGAIFYRPLSVQVYTWISRQLFGLNPMGFHAIALGLHLVNVFLVYRIVKKLVGSKSLAMVAGLMYGVHPVHFMSLNWVAEFSMVLAPLFAFLAILAVMNQKYLSFWLWSGLALLSNELAVSVPLIAGLYLILKKRWRSLLWLLGPILGAVGLVYLRFVAIPTSLGQEYVLTFDPGSWWSNLRWQLIRAVGFPEGFKAHLGMTQLKLAVGGVTAFWLVMLWFLVINKWVKVRRREGKLCLFGLLWWVTSLLPVLFLAHHQSPIYQIIGLPGLLVVVTSFWPKFSRAKIRVSAVTILFVISSLWSVAAMYQYHWVIQRAKIARYHLEKLQKHQPVPGTKVEFLNTRPQSSTQVYLALAGEKGVKAFFGDEVTAEFEDFTDTVLSPAAIYVLSRVEME